MNPIIATIRRLALAVAAAEHFRVHQTLPPWAATNPNRSKERSS